MIKFFVVVAMSLAICAAAAASEQQRVLLTSSQAVPATGSEAASVPAGTLVQAELSKTVDAKKARVGDAVTAKTTNDVAAGANLLLPRGTRIVGHISAVKPSSKESRESSLGIAFDKAVMKGNREVPLHAVVQAAAPPERPASFAGMDQGGGDQGGVSPGMGGAQPRMGASGGAVNAGGSRGQAPAQGPPNADDSGISGSVAPVDTGGRLSPRASGALGLGGITLSTSSDAAHGSVFSSQKGNVRLDSGTQMVLRVTQ